jgi:hypothetical protein
VKTPHLDMRLFSELFEQSQDAKSASANRLAPPGRLASEAVGAELRPLGLAGGSTREIELALDLLKAQLVA